MNLTGNTILITGGGSGIGRGLAEAFHALGNRVIIAGRRKQALDETTAANPGMASMQLDIEDPSAIRAFAAVVAEEFPTLNVLFNNAGIMRAEKLLAQQEDLADAEAIVATNLLGPIRLTAALLPLLQNRNRSQSKFVYKKVIKPLRNGRFYRLCGSALLGQSEPSGQFSNHNRSASSSRIAPSRRRRATTVGPYRGSPA